MKLPAVLLLLTALKMVSGHYPFDCSDILKKDSSKPSGIYTIYLYVQNLGVQVQCDMETLGGGWTVFQQRMDGTINFIKLWSHYKEGFGNVSSEYWLGLENLYLLTQIKIFELLVEMTTFTGMKGYARYQAFKVHSEDTKYLLTVSGYDRNLPGPGEVQEDQLFNHNNQKFSTIKSENNPSKCAEKHLGGFWYHNCVDANPNGLYIKEHNRHFTKIGIVWASITGNHGSLKTFSMKVRPIG